MKYLLVLLLLSGCATVAAEPKKKETKTDNTSIAFYAGQCATYQRLTNYTKAASTPQADAMLKGFLVNEAIKLEITYKKLSEYCIVFVDAYVKQVRENKGKVKF